ncbi:MAG: hypothetical protein P4L45_00270, partial [Ignavibacteriaceae bacterium]|nr:hypothetical protein [Ignavibacteriaceae bacterium]
INNNLSDNNKISFKIYGPEKIIDLNDWSAEKRDKYFISERDEYSSAKIINLLENDSSAKAIVFYGGAHLITIKTQKLPNNKDQGFYLGYYLSKYFKDKGGCYSIDQVSIWNNYLLNDMYKFTNKNYAIENSIFNGAAIPKDVQPQSTDASLVLFDKNIRQPHISQILSENLVNCYLDKTSNYKNLKSEFNRAINAGWLDYLSIISGSEFENINNNDSVSVNKAIDKWINWRANNRINFADEIINLSIIKKCINRFENLEYPEAGFYENTLYYRLLDTKIWFSQGATPKLRAKGYNEYIQNYSKPIIYENLINLLWVGTKEEKHKAISYLKSSLSLNLNTAKEWTEWWRNSDYCK